MLVRARLAARAAGFVVCLRGRFTPAPFDSCSTS
jgi:hypothetical protein